MSKDADKEGQTSKLSFEDKFISERVKNAELEAQIKVKDARVNKLEHDVSRLRKGSTADDSLPETPKEETKLPEPKEEPKSTSPHLVRGYTPRYCPDKGCEALPQNPAFKDETVCSGPGCGMHLGSLENVQENLGRCPNCGSVKFDAIKK